jgi:hypothetical protein
MRHKISWEDNKYFWHIDSPGKLSLILREEHRLKLFESRLLRKILGPKSEKGAGVAQSV